MKLLITGFVPFGGGTDNPSRDCLRMLPSAIEDVEIHTMELPVAFREAPAVLLEALERLSPDAVVCLGVAVGRGKITPEKVAINLAHARIPDNEGAQPREQPLAAGGPDGLFSTLPVFELVRTLEQRGIPAEVSYTAGAYVCNCLFYNLMTWAIPRGIPAGFIHVPAAKDLPLEETTRAVLTVIDCLKLKFTTQFSDLHRTHCRAYV